MEIFDTVVSHYHINTQEKGELHFAGETKEEAEKYAQMAGWTIVSPTVKAHRHGKKWTREGNGESVEELVEYFKV